MNDLPDARLLEQFVHSGSEEAFATVVERYIALVHSTALRHTDNPQEAQDITQAVFIVLAHKAASLGCKVILPGWLYHTTRLTAANIQRAEARRLRREQEAFMQSKPQEPVTDALWSELSPQLDKAMGTLNPGERDALVMRYFQNMSMTEVGQSLGLTQNTAQKRICRALEKLHRFFSKRGVTSTTAIIAQAISVNSVQAVPAAMTKSVTAMALAKGATASSSTLTLCKGALKVMVWTKVKTAVIGAILIAIVTTTGVIVHYHTNVSARERVVGAAGDYWAVNDLSNAGYGDPKSALKTTLFAMTQADVQGFLASCAPQLKAEREKAMQGKSEAELSAEAKKQFANVTAVRISGTTNVSADTVIFSLHLEGANQNHRLVFKQVDGQWKLAGST